jgi:hypothetical protein
MIYKEFNSDVKKVEVYRKKNTVENGYEYYLQVLTKGIFGDWNLNSRYTQTTPIYSQKLAFELAVDLLNKDI